MMLRTSLRNINPALNMFKLTFRKNIGLILLLSIAMLVLSPGYLLINIESQIELDGFYNIEGMFTGFVAIVAVAASIAVVVFNIINFMFMYSKKSGDVFHSLPLKRSELLLSRSLAGIASVLIPVTLGFLGLAGLTLFVPGVEGRVGPVITGYFYTVMTVLVTSGISMLFIVCAGTVFDFAVSFIGANGGILLAGYIGCYLPEYLLLGYNGSDYSKVLKVLSPLYYCGYGIGDSYGDLIAFDGSDAVWFVRTSIYVILFFAAAVIFYNRRKAEKGGEAYAYKFIYIFCGVLAGFCGAYLGGLLFTDGGGDINIIFWIGAVLGALITAVTYGAVSDRGFKGAKRSIIIGITSVLIMAGEAAFAVTGMFGFTERIPVAGNIEAVVLRVLNEDIVSSDPALALKLHRAIVNNKDDLVANFGYYYDGSHRTYVYFDYDLKNGKTMSRAFRIKSESIEKELFEVYSSPDRFDNIRQKLNASNPDYLSVYVNELKYIESEDCTQNMVDINAAITENEFRRFLDIYEKEVQGASTDIVIREEIKCINILWYKNYNYYDFEFRIDDTFTETLAYIDSLNLASRMGEEY